MEAELDLLTTLAENICNRDINNDLRILLSTKVRSYNDAYVTNSAELSNACKVLNKRNKEYIKYQVE